MANGKRFDKIKYREEIVGIRTYKTKFIAEITHSGLNDFKVLTSDDSGILRNKVNAHVAKLEEKWDRIVQKENIVRSKEEIQNEAELLTQDAINDLKEIDNLLLFTLEIDDKVDWEQLKDRTKFNVQSPENQLNKLLSAVNKPTEPVYNSKPSKPDERIFKPEISFFDSLIKSRKEAKISKAKTRFEDALKEWEANCNKIDLDNQTLKEKFNIELAKYENQIEDVKKRNKTDILDWEREKSEFISNQEQTNLKVDKMKEMYLNLDPSSVIEYCDLVLNNSIYPESS